MASTEVLEIPGINIRSPWGELIASGRKTVETRSYSLPKRYLGKDLAIIETYGTKAGSRHARIIAVVTFSNCFLYHSKQQWLLDSKRHLVRPNDPEYGFMKNVPKWGWEVSKVRLLEVPQAPPKRRGIIYARTCKVLVPVQ